MSSRIILIALFSVSLFSTPKDWNGADYHKNSASQQTAAHKMLEGIQFTGSERILDVGCGDGKITDKMADMVPKGHVVGIDKSASMIEFAKKQFKAPEFEIQDAETLARKDKFDLVVSFSTMQWVLNQKEALSNMKSVLKPGGKVMISMPAQYPVALAKSLEETMAESIWKGYFKTYKTPQVFFKADEYETLLKSIGFESVDVKIIPMPDKFKSVEAFGNFVKQWLPHLNPVPKDKQTDFLADVMKHYVVHSPAAEDGSVTFDKLTLEATAEVSHEISKDL